MTTNTPPAVTITQERPDSAEAMRIIGELDASIDQLYYPDESRHGYSVDKLIREGVAFFVTRLDGAPAGCGGIQLFGTEYGEVKRMFVRPQFRGLGLAKFMLDHLTEYARANKIGILRLETGIHQSEAIRLYERYGFERRGPFGDYKNDLLSIYFEKWVKQLINK